MPRRSSGRPSAAAKLFALARRHGVTLAAMGTHPWAAAKDQRIIDTPHYNLLREELAWVARRNQTWSLHTHVGIRGADRAVAVCDHMRGVLPVLLAISANSPFLDHDDTGLASVRTQLFTRTFPRCGIHEPFGDWETYAEFVAMLERTSSIVESTQLWWSVRPHHSFGTVEVRICDAQSDGDASFRLGALMLAAVAQSAIDYDDGNLAPPQQGRQVEENLWRAIRHGVDGRMIDFSDGTGAAGEIEVARGDRAVAGVDGAGARGARPRRRAQRRQRRPARAGRARGRPDDRGGLPRHDRRDRPHLRARLGRLIAPMAGPTAGSAAPASR